MPFCLGANCAGRSESELREFFRGWLLLFRRSTGFILQMGSSCSVAPVSWCSFVTAEALELERQSRTTTGMKFAVLHGMFFSSLAKCCC